MSSIKKELTSGVAYNAIAKYSGMAIQLCITAILARLLTPQDYGVIAIATIFINFFNLLGDVGIGPAIIQNQSLDKNDYKNIFSYTVYTGLSLSFIFFLCSWPIASYYEEEQLVPVCQCLSVLILFFCFTIVPQNLLYKAKKFKLISLSNLAIHTLTGLLAIGAAYLGWGVYSLILQTTLAALFTFILYYSHTRIHFTFYPKWYSLKKIWLFSIYQFLFNIINFFGRNMDKMLIGRALGMKPLGFYEKSYRLMMLPLQNITFVINPVLLPVFSSLQTDVKELTDKYFKMLKMLSYISFPISAILFVCGEELILSFFGDQWGEAVGTFRILALTVGMQVLTSTTGSVFQAIGQTKQMFFAGLCGAFFMITSFLITLNIWGTIESVAWGYFVAQILNTIQCFYLILRSLRYSSRRLLKDLYKPVLISVVMIALLFFVTKLIFVPNIYLRLAIYGSISLIIAFIFIQLFSDYNLIGLIKQQLKKYGAKVR